MVIFTDELFDISIDDSGYIKFSDEANKYNTLAKFDIVSNNNWELDKGLGIPWATPENDGLLQNKANDYNLLSTINAKLTTLEYFKELETLELRDVGNDRNGSLIISFIATDDSIVTMEVE